MKLWNTSSLLFGYLSLYRAARRALYRWQARRAVDRCHRRMGWRTGWDR